MPIFASGYALTPCKLPLGWGSLELYSLGTLLTSITGKDGMPIGKLERSQG